MDHLKLINTAAATVSDRLDDYGTAAENFDRIAKLASILLSKPVTRYDVSIIMTAVKLSRMAQNPMKTDSYVDGIAYMAFAGEFIRTDAPTKAVEKEIAKEVAREFGLQRDAEYISTEELLKRLDESAEAAEMAKKLAPKVKIDIAGGKPTVERK